jgi:uncharacterized protein (DUF1697 family)
VRRERAIGGFSPVRIRAIHLEPEMAVFVALLRAVNVGGTGKLPMARLLELCADAGFPDARAYIASGNVIIRNAASERAVRDALEARLHAHAGKPVGVLVRTAVEIAQLVTDNPFADKPGNRIMALFTDARLPQRPLDGAVGIRNEEVRLGPRALFVFYPDGMARSRLRLPSERNGTARNMNTVAKLAELAGNRDRCRLTGERQSR